MKIGCPAEIKPQEFRVGVTPSTAGEAVRHGHEVIVQAGAGEGAGFPDSDYVEAGVRIVDGSELHYLEDFPERHSPERVREVLG